MDIAGPDKQKSAYSQGVLPAEGGENAISYSITKFLRRKGGTGMECRTAELRYKEVIDVRDGTRYGYVGDVELDTATGQIRALVIYGRPRWFGLLGREEDTVFSWSEVRRFGEDIILVEAGRRENRKEGRSGRRDRKFFL